MRIVFSSFSSLVDLLRLSFGAVRPALRALERRSIPLILWSGRTLGEILATNEPWFGQQPLVVEGGSALYVPEDYFPSSVFDSHWQPANGFHVYVCGVRREALKPVLQHLRHRLQADLVCFSDWTAAELAIMLGIPIEAAEQAQQRQFSEVFQYQGDPDHLRQALLDAPVLTFPVQVEALPAPLPAHHWLLTAHNQRAIPTLLQCYQQHVGAVVSLGIGWHPQDLGFLPWMDQAVILPSPQEAVLWQQPGSRWTKGDLPAPEGWNEAVLTWLEATDQPEELDGDA
ncbi:MAG: hypothetical protein OHK0012_01230 [Synechococcales cyanobacterium]